MASAPIPGVGPVDPFAGIAWDNTFGALLIAGLLSGILYGITCTQCYVFYERSGSDPLSLRLFVACLWVLDSLDFALNCHLVYYYLVSNFMNPLALMAKPVWSLLIHVLITSVTDFMVRTMFARRIWRLSHENVLLTAGVMATSLLDLVVGIVIAVKAFRLPSIMDLSELSTLFYVNFAAGTGSDIYVAIALSYFLWTSRTGFNTRTDSVINVLILYTINTGDIDAFMGMLLYIIMPHNYIFVTFYLQLNKLYSNAYLATLNNRGVLREKSSGDGVVSIHLSQMSGTIGTFARPTVTSEQDVEETKNASVMEILVDRNMEVTMDGMREPQNGFTNDRSPKKTGWRHSADYVAWFALPHVACAQTLTHTQRWGFRSPVD